MLIALKLIELIDVIFLEKVFENIIISLTLQKFKVLQLYRGL